MTLKKALITGIAGQDGSCLSELLLAKGYEVHGIVRQERLEDISGKLGRLGYIKDRIVLYQGDVNSLSSLTKTLDRV